jgi:uncharacterized MAPEG superfamily protein
MNVNCRRKILRNRVCPRVIASPPPPQGHSQEEEEAAHNTVFLDVYDSNCRGTSLFLFRTNNHSDTMAGSSFYEQVLAATGKGTPNYALYGVPVMWLLCIAPHFFAVGLSKGQFKNTSPRGYLAEIQKKAKLSPTDEKYIRAEACQQNGFENLPFFAAAVLAGTVVSSPGLVSRVSLSRRCSFFPLGSSFSPSFHSHSSGQASKRRSQCAGSSLPGLSSGLQPPLHLCHLGDTVQPSLRLLPRRCRHQLDPLHQGRTCSQVMACQRSCNYKLEPSLFQKSCDLSLT